MKINLLHTWNIFIIELLYCTGILVVFVAYLFFTGKGSVHTEHYSVADYVLYAIFVILFILAPLYYNIMKWRKFKIDGNVTESRSYIIVEVLLIVLTTLLVTN
ncbi:hypothetical protein Q766_02420 [Flavobacterium subsaxonicum WB 4.1-42 = DSM 21790]|uniref:Uncharacterized protein n=1 Tax=Flavobacterium subsaxonicum WB 4.1-42 = DSM 21790 TaxID=1121898 RepID=A0A0A2N3F2_9FLAO|nr:hypothetical protein Q766_02420 [Flavobacterium subsaxonicum WB 4.1-42 = DSM 21790]